jgi:hypothetical protein
MAQLSTPVTMTARLHPAVRNKDHPTQPFMTATQIQIQSKGASLLLFISRPPTAISLLSNYSSNAAPMLIHRTATKKSPYTLHQVKADLTSQPFYSNLAQMSILEIARVSPHYTKQLKADILTL